VPNCAEHVHEAALLKVLEWRCQIIGTPKIYTTTGFGPRKNREMAGVDHLVVYMQTAAKYSSLYIHHPGGASRPRGGVYRKFRILEQIAYKPPNGPHQPFPYSF